MCGETIGPCIVVTRLFGSVVVLLAGGCPVLVLYTTPLDFIQIDKPGGVRSARDGEIERRE
jgi:hypothetical protein